jgi:tripartite-type tricarboxylate transporter receptor subunit TctC
MTSRRALLASPLLARPARAQPAWPTRPVRIVVPFPPGGPADVLARAMAEPLSNAWGQSVVIDNRGGAGGNLGAELVARSAADGHTLLLPASSHVQGAGLYRNLPFHPVHDFTAVTMLAYYALVLVLHPATPAADFAGFQALARSKPGAVTLASAGVGTPTHLSAELYRLRAGVEFTHVPYQGAAPAHAAVLGGQVMAMFTNPVLAIPAIRAGTLRGIAVTGATRSQPLPELPTIAEQGYPGYEAGTWYGFLGPAGMPESVVQRIHADTQQALAAPVLRQRFAAMGLEPMHDGPAAFTQRLADDLARWTEVIRAGNIRME